MTNFNEQGFSVKEQILAIVAGLLIVAIAGWFFPLTGSSAPSMLSGASGTQYIEDYDPLVMQAGLNTNKAVSFGSTLSVAGAFTQTGAATFSGLFGASATSTFSGLSIFDTNFNVSSVNSTTTTGSAVTLTEVDLGPAGKCYGTFSFTKTEGTSGGGNLSTTTLTTAASSTFATIIPNVGDFCDMNIESATSSASQLGMIWAFGTGWDPQTASTTPTGLTINGGDSAMFRIYRKFNTDIGVAIVIGKDAN